MATDQFSYRSLTKGVTELIPAPRFFVDNFARKGRNHPAKIVDIAGLSGQVKLAPFTSPNTKGQLVGKRPMNIKTVRFPKHRLYSVFGGDDLTAVNILQPNLYANGDPSGLLAQQVVRQLQELKDMIMYRIEWQFAKMITANGWTYTDAVTGECFTVDYGIPAANKGVSVSVDWDESTANPVVDIKALGDKVMLSSTGPMDRLIFGTSAWAWFTANTKILSLFDNRRMNFGSINAPSGQLFSPVGSYGNIQMYVSGELEDDNSTPLIPADYIVGFSSMNDFFYDFGIVDEVGIGTDAVTDFFSKSYIEENPSQRIILVEANPLAMVKDARGIAWMDVKAS